MPRNMLAVMPHLTKREIKWLQNDLIYCPIKLMCTRTHDLTETELMFCDRERVLAVLHILSDRGDHIFKPTRLRLIKKIEKY